MNLTYTVQDIVRAGLSKLGVDPLTTEAQNIDDAHRNLNLLLGQWSADEDMHIGGIVPLYGYANLGDTVTLPEEYCNALVLNLAVLLAPDYGISLDKGLAILASEAVNTIKRHNLKFYSNGSIPRNQLAP